MTDFPKHEPNAQVSRLHYYKPDAQASEYWQPFRFTRLRLGLVLSVLSMLFSAALVAACIPQSQAQSARVFDQREQTFVAGLLQRRLYNVAEAHCLELLDRKEIQVVDQTALTVQLVQTRTLMALIADAAGAENAWQAVWQTGEDFDKRFARHPGRLQVSIQTGLAHLQRAQRMGGVIEAQMVSRADLPSATNGMLQQCRDAKRIFTGVEGAIDRLLPERRSKTIADGELSPQELLALKSSVRYQIALCQMQVAAAYQDNDSVSWESALNDVLKRLQEVQDSVVPSQQIWWRSKVSQLECLLTLGKTNEVARLLSTLPDEGPPPNILPRLLEQQLRLAIETGDKAKIEAHLLADQSTKGRAEAVANSAPLELVRIRAAVELSKLLDDLQQKKVWLEAAAQKKQMVQLRYGAWWGRRAGLALIQAAGGTDVTSAAGPSGSPTNSLGTTPHTAAVELLLQTALQAQRNGDLEDAVKAYDRAIEQSANLPAEVLRLQIRVSQIFEQQSQPLKAARRLTIAASRAPNQRLAAATHLRGVWNLARANVASSAADGTSLIAALNEHLAKWSKGPTKDTAALWLMAEYIRLNDADEALVAFDAVDSSSDSFPEALTQIRALFFQTGKLKIPKQASRKLARDIVAKLRVRYDGLEEADDRNHAASLVSVATEIGLESEAMSVEQLARWLADFQQRFPVAPADSSEVNELLGWSSLLMILNNKSPAEIDVTEAAKVLASTKPNEAMCRRLYRVVSNRESDLAISDGQRLSQRRALQLFGLEIIGIVNRLPLSARESDRWKFQWGSLLRKTGQPEEAVSLLEPLAQRFRTDLLIQLEFARALSEIEVGIRQEDALKVWRRLAKSLTPATENWYEARLNVARQLDLSGDNEAAKKLLLYTRSVYGWDKSNWGEDLDRLLRTLRTVSNRQP